MVDLEKHRQKVIDAIIRLKQIPLSMEHLPSAYRALAHWTISKNRSSRLIFFYYYSAPPWAVLAGDTTFIKKEYELALKHEKDILGPSYPDHTFREGALRDFRTSILNPGSATSPIVSKFETPEEAGVEAYHSLSVLISKKNTVGQGGWIDASPYDRVGGPFFDRYLEFFLLWRNLTDA